MADPTLHDDLASLEPHVATELKRHGFRPERLHRWVEELLHGDEDANRVRGAVEPPLPQDISLLPDRASASGRELSERGMEALGRGEMAFVVMAGGMATRMGGVVKALVEAVPGVTFLDARLAERDHWSRLAGAEVPLWLMTSHATDAPIRDALADRADAESLAVFPQLASVRVTPRGRLFRDSQGRPSLHATGHGDLHESVLSSGLLDSFVQRGGRWLWIANLDNLGAAIDPLVLGWHIAQTAPLTVEVVDKEGGDRGGIPVRHEGRPVILENFRLPRGFDEDAVRVFNTNTFLADAAELMELEREWTYFRVEKRVEERSAIQFERLIGELTSWLDTCFLKVPRHGPESRFLPAKDHDELARNRDLIAQRLAPVLPAL